MSLGHETVIKEYTARSPRQLEAYASQALTDLGDTLCILASEDTMKKFLFSNIDLKDPKHSFERIRMEKKFLGKPFAFEKAAGDTFVFTSLDRCVKVRYAAL